MCMQGVYEYMDIYIHIYQFAKITPDNINHSDELRDKNVEMPFNYPNTKWIAYALSRDGYITSFTCPCPRAPLTNID